MGLDMYLTGERHLHSSSPKRGEKKGEFFRLGYWWDHPNLHHYIVAMFAHGDDHCQRIELSADCLRDIIERIEEVQLPRTSRTCPGQSGGDASDEDVTIFREAITWLEATDEEAWRSIYYQASW